MPFLSPIRLALLALLFAPCAAHSLHAQECSPSGYRVLSRRWDAVLNMGWELRADCSHPEWPARSVAVPAAEIALAANAAPVQPSAALSAHASANVTSKVANSSPLLVHAGESVRLWSQSASVRIELTGTAESSGRAGDRINVRLTHESPDQPLAVQHVAGIVHGPQDVEMSQ